VVDRNRNKEIDTIEYKESLGNSCFQGFLTFYRYKGEVIRVGAFYQDTLDWYIVKLYGTKDRSC